MLNILKNYYCGGFVFDSALSDVVSTAVLAIKIFIPVILIIFGMLDMGKAVMAGDEKATKENQSKFIKRLFYAVLVFLIISIVQVALSLVASSGGNKAADCIDCFINGKCTTYEQHQAAEQKKQDEKNKKKVEENNLKVEEANKKAEETKNNK